MLADGELDQRQRADYWHEAFTFTPQMQQRVRPGKPLAIMTLIDIERRGNTALISSTAAIEQISVDGRRVYTRPPDLGAGYLTSQSPGVGGSLREQRKLPLDDGSNSVSITWTCTVGEPDVDPSTAETYDSRWTIERTFQVEVVPEPQPMVRWVSDPDISKTIQKNTSISRIVPQIDQTSPSLYVSIHMDPSPVALAMDVLLSAEGTETHLFYITQPAGQGSQDPGDVVRLDATPTEATIILRPSDDALGTLEADEVFGGELRFPITIAWPQDE